MNRLRAAAILLVVLALAVLGAAPSTPVPVERTLANGLRVVVFQRAGWPIVQTQLQVRGGLTAEAQGAGGLAYLTAQMLRQGTSSRSATTFAAELDTLGATLAVNVSRDVAQIVTGSRAPELESVLELVSDAVVNPLFDEDAMQESRRTVAGQLGQIARNPQLVADERLAALVFGEHPYGRPLRGDLEALLGTTRDQARQFHRDYWRPDQAVLVIAGDVAPARAFAAAEEWFGRWEGRAKPIAKVPVPALRKRTFLFDLPGSPVTEVRVALLGPGRGEQNHAGWVVARAALEGGLLPTEAHAALVSGSEASLLVLNASARPESTAAVALRLQRALKTLGGLTAASPEWTAARTRASGEWALSLETLGQLASSWLSGDAARMEAGHLGAQPVWLAAAKPDDVAAAARAGALALLVGPADRMKGRLASLGPIDSAKVEVRSEAVTAMVGPQATAEQKQAGARLIAAAITAHGGRARLDAVRNSQMKADLRLAVGGQELTGEMSTLRIDPDRLVQVTRVLALEHQQVLDRDRGWRLSLAGDSAALIPADTTALVSMRGILEGDLVHLLRAASTPRAGAFAAGKGVVAGQPVDHVEFLSPVSARTRLSLDAKTHRIVMVEGVPTPQGEWRDRRRWSGFQLYEGVWWPTAEERELDGQLVSKATTTNMQVNIEVDSTLFRRPLVVRGEIRGLE